MKAGFTLIEIVLIILLVGILSVVAAVKFQDFRGDAKTAVTQNELIALRRAIAGDSRMIAGGEYVFKGYEGDKLGLPTTLADLVINPATGNTTQDYNPLTRQGWRGPYIDNSTTSDYSTDAWGNAYVYDSAGRKLRSKGPNGVDNAGAGDDIEVSF